jgi:beta-glucosidase
MANRTYRYFRGKPLYGFGYGLSYARFRYGNLKLSRQSLSAGEPLTVDVDVTNAGGPAGDEVVQLYLTQPKLALTPLHTLGGFTRVRVEPGATVHVRFELDPRTLGQVDEKGQRVVVAGRYAVAVGGAQPAEFPGAVTASFDVTGSRTLPR